MKRLKLIIPIVIVSLLLSGCTVGTEPNDIAYVVAIGIDTGNNENYKITIQFARPTQISGGASEEGGKGSEIVENIAVEAPNIYSAVNIANNIVSKKFSLSHAKLIVFSREIAEKGIGDIMDTLIRSYEIRPDMYLAVAPKGASEYLHSVQPVVEVNPAKFYQLTFEKNSSIGIPEYNVIKFYFCQSQFYNDGVLPITGVLDQPENSSEGGGSSEGGSSEGGENSGSSEGGSSGGGESGSSPEEKAEAEGKVKESEAQESVEVNEGGFEYRMKNYIAGEVAVKEKNKSEAMGMALFKKNKMVGIMGGIETELYNILNGSYDYGYVSFYSEKSPDTPITVKLNQPRKPRIKVDVKNKKISIKLYFESDFYSLPADYITEKDVNSFESESKENIEKACRKFIDKTLNEYHVDVLGFAKKAKYNFMTYKKFKEEMENQNFEDYDIDIKVNFDVKHSGMTIREKQNIG